jgi:glycine cleavage system H protein
LPNIDDKFDNGAQFATLESVKAVSECYLPVSGTIVEVNDQLKENPKLINDSSFDLGKNKNYEIYNIKKKLKFDSKS